MNFAFPTERDNKTPVKLSECPKTEVDLKQREVIFICFHFSFLFLSSKEINFRGFNFIIEQFLTFSMNHEIFLCSPPRENRFFYEKISFRIQIGGIIMLFSVDILDVHLRIALWYRNVCRG